MVLTFDKEMAVCDCGSEGVLSSTHVFTLVIREHLLDGEDTLALVDVNVDVEVSTGHDRLAVEEPGDDRLGRTSVHHPEYSLVAIVDSQVT